MTITVPEYTDHKHSILGIKNTIVNFLLTFLFKEVKLVPPLVSLPTFFNSDSSPIVVISDLLGIII